MTASGAPSPLRATKVPLSHDNERNHATVVLDPISTVQNSPPQGQRRCHARARQQPPPPRPPDTVRPVPPGMHGARPKVCQALMAGNDCSKGVSSPPRRPRWVRGVAQASETERGSGVCSNSVSTYGHRDLDEKSLTCGRTMARTVGWPAPEWRMEGGPPLHAYGGRGAKEATQLSRPRRETWACRAFGLAACRVGPHGPEDRGGKGSGAGSWCREGVHGAGGLSAPPLATATTRCAL